jgi:hypothetical protein
MRISNVECRIMKVSYSFVLQYQCFSQISKSTGCLHQSRSKVLPSFDIHHSLFDIRYSKYIPNTISQLKLVLMGFKGSGLLNRFGFYNIPDSARTGFCAESAANASCFIYDHFKIVVFYFLPADSCLGAYSNTYPAVPAGSAG